MSMAQAVALRVWQLVDMDTLETWTNKRLALLGDAAHPLLPCELEITSMRCNVASDHEKTRHKGQPRP
jgi:hypothetical protein